MRTSGRSIGFIVVRAVLTVAVLGFAIVYAANPPHIRTQDVPLTIVTVANSGNSGAGNDATFDLNATTVSGLYPGAVRALALSVRNPYQFDIQVTDLSAALTATSNPACAATAANLVARPYLGPPTLPLTVPGGQVRAAGVIPLAMPNTVANACQNTTFTLRLAGTATKANK
jgi:hypothetical protein